jgi:hypothetical protein
MTRRKIDHMADSEMKPPKVIRTRAKETRYIQIDFALPPGEGTMMCPKHGEDSPTVLYAENRRIYCRRCLEEQMERGPVPCELVHLPEGDHISMGCHVGDPEEE